jgi:general stress protein YciG
MIAQTQTHTISVPTSPTDRITDSLACSCSSADTELFSPSSDAKPKRLRGFARMTKEKHRRVASEGGIAAQQSMLAHRFTSATARSAGKIGGRRIAQNRDYMRELGRRGGLAKGVSMARKRTELATVQSVSDAGTTPTDTPASRATRAPVRDRDIVQA